MKNYFFGILLLISMPAWATLPFEATAAEKAMCQARIYSRLGERNQNTIHMHHYCDGLRFLDRAYASLGNKEDMRHYLDLSIDGFDYALSHTEEGYAMRGEIYMGKATALKLAGKKGEAAAEYIKALRYNPDSSIIYLELADFYQGMGDKPKALEYVTEGLRHIPVSKGLKSRYTELGGKLPYPEPATKIIPGETAGVEVKSEVKSEVTPGAVPPSAETPSQVVDDTKIAAPAATTPPVEQPKIGSPRNPYCRFCTD